MGIYRSYDLVIAPSVVIPSLLPLDVAAQADTCLQIFIEYVSNVGDGLMADDALAVVGPMHRIESSDVLYQDFPTSICWENGSAGLSCCSLAK